MPVKKGDKIRFYNITVLYPDGQIIVLEEKTIYIEFY